MSVLACYPIGSACSAQVLVTFMLSSVWHAILDNFRPISIWAVQIVLYYYVTDGQHGEPWGEGRRVPDRWHARAARQMWFRLR